MPTTNLSKRHIECLQGVAALKSSKQIAIELGISSKTVDNYLAEAMTILGASNRREAASKFVALNTPEKSPGEATRVVGGGPEVAAVVSQPASNMPTGRGLERYSKLHRLGIIIAMSLAISLGIGLCAVAVVGMIAIYDTPRPSTR